MPGCCLRPGILILDFELSASGPVRDTCYLRGGIQRPCEDNPNLPVAPASSIAASMIPLVDLKPDEIRLWYCPLASLDDAARNACRKLLDPDETARLRRYLSASAADQFLVGRAALRSCLSRCTGLAPADWQFVLNKHGKPRLAETHARDWLSFNVSHSRGMVVCALCRGGDLGVDVEPLDEEHNLEVAERFFTPGETAVIQRALGVQQQEVFLKTWTLKEAVIKARGEGLSLPLASFEIDLTATTPQVRFLDRGDDDPGCWQLFEFRLESRFQAAVAICHAEDSPVRLTTARLDLGSSGISVL
jgi:4'-phosphopantetheinyl transferase